MTAEALWMQRLVHGCLTMVVVYMGVVFALPYATLDSSPTFRVMASIMTEEHWAATLLSIAALCLLTFWSRGPRMRVLGSSVLSATHVTVGLMLTLGNPNGIALGSFLACGVLAAGLAWRVAHDSASTLRGLATPRTP